MLLSILKKIFIFVIIATVPYTSSANNDTATKLLQCSKITANKLRLQCFDALVIKLSNPKTHQTVDIHEDTANKPTPKADISTFGREHKLAQIEKQQDQVEFVIKSAKLNVYKKWRLTFTNGQVWHASEANRALKLKVGDHVIIKRGVLNSFSLHKKGAKRSVKIKRIK